MGPNSSNSATTPTRKNLCDVKIRYSPFKKAYNKYKNVLMKEYKFGLLSLELKKSTDIDEDAYYKVFLDIIKEDSSISEKLGIV
jgi:hypothetical protein